MDAAITLIALFLLIAIGCAIVLPIAALVSTARLRRRVTELERMLKERPPAGTAPPERVSPPPVLAKEPVEMTAPVRRPRAAPVQPRTAAADHIRVRQPAELESQIGRRWIGWTAVILILFAVAFFLRYAFENRWIGELGRVTLGMFAGLSLVIAGYRYYIRGWRVFSQILTGGGIMLLYLSIYASFGYYDLVSRDAAFAFLLVLVVESGGLASYYNAPAIGVMALVGGFLVPVLLRSDRDQYRALFAYIGALDVGVLTLLRSWVGLSSLAFGGTHLLYWLWYAENYHPQKRAAVVTFHVCVFLIFLGTYLVRHGIQRRSAGSEDLALLFLNPFFFFATGYHLLDNQYHDWMGVFAVALGAVYAGAARFLLARSPSATNQLLMTIGTSLVFITLAIPIQLKSNWITVAWAAEALVMLWVGLRVRSNRLRFLAACVGFIALAKLVVWDTPFLGRQIFVPVLNRYFLSALAVTLCLAAAALAYEKYKQQAGAGEYRLKLGLILLAVGVLWFAMTVEIKTYFDGRALIEKISEEARHERWLGQMAISVSWAVYAALLTAAGFLRRVALLRWAALVLFGVTVIKVVFIDMAELRQFYRITAFFVLGLLLLVVAWGYQRVFGERSREDESVNAE